MATECSTCLAVARGGRIRLTEEGAAVNAEALTKQRNALLMVRRTAIDANEISVAGEAGLKIRQIDVLLEEIERTQIEKGWRTSHEPERSHT